MEINKHTYILRMLASDDVEEREWAVSKTIELRKGARYGETKVTVRYGKLKDRYVNMDATSYRNLIDWSKAQESPLTVKLSTEVSLILHLKETWEEIFFISPTNNVSFVIWTIDTKRRDEFNTILGFV